MGALDQGLALAGALPAALPAAAGTGILTSPPSAASAADAGTPAAATAPAAPTPPTIAPSPMLSPGGALSQAMQINAGVQKAVAADPAQAAVKAALDQDKAAREEAATRLQANQDAYDKVAAEPSPVLTPPVLTPLPNRADYVKTTQQGLQGFAQFIPILAAFGSLATRQPALNALKAGSAMMEAIHNNNLAEEVKQRQAWLDATNVATKTNDEQNQAFRNVLDNAQLTATERQARLNALAVDKGNIIAQAQLKGGNVAPLVNVMQVTDAASQHLAGIVTTLQAQDIQRQNLGREWAQTNIDAYKAQIEAGKVSPNDVAGQLFMRMQAVGGYDKLSDVDKDMFGRLAQYEQSLHPPQNNYVLTGGGAAAPSAPAPAPAAATAPAAAPAPAPAPAVAPALLSARAAQAKQALRAPGVTRDQVRAVWVQQGLPPAEFDRLVK